MTSGIRLEASLRVVVKEVVRIWCDVLTDIDQGISSQFVDSVGVLRDLRVLVLVYIEP